MQKISNYNYYSFDQIVEDPSGELNGSTRSNQIIASCVKTVLNDTSGSLSDEQDSHSKLRERCQNISPAVLDIIIKYSDKCRGGGSPLNYAILEHDWNSVDILIQSGIGINTKGSRPYAGQTPIIQLLLLSQSGDRSQRENGKIFLKKIILKGIDPLLPIQGARGELTQGQYVLMESGFLFRHDLWEELKLFLTIYEIDLNSSDFAEKPIQRALGGGDYKIIETLIEHGAKVDDIDCFSNVSVSGKFSNAKAIITLLINSGAKPLRISNSNPKMTDIDTLLKKTILYGQEDFKREMIPYLIDLGAQINFD